MKLTFKDRITILHGGVLPFSDSISGIKISRSIREKIGLSVSEKASLGFKELGDGRFSYQTNVDLSEFGMDADITEEELTHLKNGAQRIEQNSTVTEDTFDTIEMLLLA